MPELIKLLKTKLLQPLPGSTAQLKLATRSRPIGSPDKKTMDAGVLILIYPNGKGNENIVFMKRPEYDGPHSGQISFPGGKYETEDIDLMQTALRESQEEIGIDRNSIEIVGKLTELFIPVSNYMVYPFVGYTNSTPSFTIDKNEVDYLIEFPLNKLIRLPILSKDLTYKGTPFPIRYFDINNETVWGATSMILSEFIEVLKQV